MLAQNQTDLQAAPKTMDKITRYGWTLQDAPGSFKYISKNSLLVPIEYQRTQIERKVLDISSKWSWFGCGVIIVAYRDGLHWVVDGQHRVAAALRRSDIKELPCMVFDSSDIASEAQAFVIVNVGRKPVTAIDKLRALSVSENEDAAFLTSTLDSLNLRLAKTATKGLDIKCVSACQKMIGVSRLRFVAAITLAAKLSLQDNTPVNERVLSALFYLDGNLPYGLDTPRFKERVLQMGNVALLESAVRAAAYYAGGGYKIWAEGMLALLNKGLRNHFVLINTSD